MEETRNKLEFCIMGESCGRRGRKKPDGNVPVNFENKPVNPSFPQTINKNKGLIYYKQDVFMEKGTIC